MSLPTDATAGASQKSSRRRLCSCCWLINDNLNVQSNSIVVIHMAVDKGIDHLSQGCCQQFENETTTFDS